MKGVILAGGEATRLRPLTLVTNKHLLPVYDKPVIYYAIEKLANAGIDRMMIITSPHHLGNFVHLLGSGQNFRSRDGHEIQIVYAVQNQPGGVAQGLRLAKDYVGNDNCVLHLGDNIFEDEISEHIQTFQSGATIFLKPVENTREFGIATVDKKGRVTKIIEKPLRTKSNLAVTGLYIYDNSVFSKMESQTPSARGEYEISYVNSKYLEEEALRAIHLKEEWFDIGTIHNLHRAGAYMSKKKNSKHK